MTSLDAAPKYDPEELYSHQMNNDEILLCLKLKQECATILTLIGVNRDLERCGMRAGLERAGSELSGLCHKEGVGYYRLIFERRNVYLEKGFPEPDEKRALGVLINSVTYRAGTQLELNSRDELMRLWGERFRAPYDSRLFWFEYMIRKLYQAKSVITDEIIAKYSGKMNLWFKEPHWRFNPASMSFEEIA